MIPEDLQDQAALYSIGVLNAEETPAFEVALKGNGIMGGPVREMREASADLSRNVPPQQPPAELKRRVLREIALEKQANAPWRDAKRRFRLIGCPGRSPRSFSLFVDCSRSIACGYSESWPRRARQIH